MTNFKTTELTKFDIKVSDAFINKVVLKYKIINTSPVFNTLNDGSVPGYDFEWTPGNIEVKNTKTCTRVKLYTQIKPYTDKSKYIKYIVDDMFKELCKIVGNNPIIYICGDLSVGISKTEEGITVRSYALKFTV